MYTKRKVTYSAKTALRSYPLKRAARVLPRARDPIARSPPLEIFACARLRPTPPTAPSRDQTHAFGRCFLQYRWLRKNLGSIPLSERFACFFGFLMPARGEEKNETVSKTPKTKKTSQPRDGDGAHGTDATRSRGHRERLRRRDATRDGCASLLCPCAPQRIARTARRRRRGVKRRISRRSRGGASIPRRFPRDARRMWSITYRYGGSCSSGCGPCG